MRELHEILGFADFVCDASRLCAYVGAATVEGGDSLDVVFRGRWCGVRWIPKDMKSKAPYVVFCKVGELVHAGAGLDGRLIVTPIVDNELSLGWMGGAALNGTVVGVSKWSQQHDRLLALAATYRTEIADLDLHHVGRRFSTEKLFNQEVEPFRHGSEEILIRPASDHVRMYYPMSRRGVRFYEEFQWFPEGPHDVAVHWDFVTRDPKGFLDWVAGAYGDKPIIFDDSGPNDPIGVYWATDKDGVKLGVMARAGWWEV